MAQFLLQLLVISHGTLDGQLIFLATLGVSWLYNVFLSAIDREKAQTRILLDDVLKLNPATDIRKYRLGNWTEAVAFTSLVLARAHPLKTPRALLDGLVPNDTPVWNTWKEAMCRKLKSKRISSDGFRFSADDRDGDGLEGKDRRLFERFLDDSEAAWNCWDRPRVKDWMMNLVSPPQAAGAHGHADANAIAIDGANGN